MNPSKIIHLLEQILEDNPQAVVMKIDIHNNGSAVTIYCEDGTSHLMGVSEEKRNGKENV